MAPHNVVSRQHPLRNPRPGETIHSPIASIFSFVRKRNAMNDFLKMLSTRILKRSPVVPVVRLTGVVASDGGPFRRTLCLAGVAATLERAFNMADEAVAIQINCPGGSPVQSRLISQRIRDLASEKKVRVFVFAEDVAASGGYMIACAADEIYADTSSIVGSVGVIFAGFGFTQLIKTIGVDRRVHTAGERKMMLDAFQPENPDDVSRLKNIQRIIHEEFIDFVRDRRGKKIEAAGDQLFTGEFWCGKQAFELGLIDGIMDVRTKMRELYGERVRLKLISPSKGLFRRPTPGVSTLLPSLTASSIAEDAIAAVEERLIWARYGM